MKVVITTSELQPLLAKKSSLKTRVLVPTMGSLHEGHLALVHRARKIAGAEGVVILSLFVNPTQFDQADDLRHYPRALEQDLALCEKHGVDIVFAPESDDI